MCLLFRCSFFGSPMKLWSPFLAFKMLGSVVRFPLLYATLTSPTLASPRKRQWPPGDINFHDILNKRHFCNIFTWRLDWSFFWPFSFVGLAIPFEAFLSLSPSFLCLNESALVGKHCQEELYRIAYDPDCVAVHGFQDFLF